MNDYCLFSEWRIRNTDYPYYSRLDFQSTHAHAIKFMNLIHTTLSRLNYERCRSCQDIKEIVISAAKLPFIHLFFSLFALPIILLKCNVSFCNTFHSVYLFLPYFRFIKRVRHKISLPCFLRGFSTLLQKYGFAYLSLFVTFFLCILYKVIIQRSHALDHTACLPSLRRDTFRASPLNVSL